LGERDNKLLELRTSKGLVQTVVGDFVNLSQTQVSAYERGRIIPSDVLIGFPSAECPYRYSQLFRRFLCPGLFCKLYRLLLEFFVVTSCLSHL